MRKNTHSESGFFNPRVFAAFLLCAAGAWMGMLAFAATPTSGTLTVSSATDNSSPSVSYSAGPFTQPNPSPLGAGQLDTGPRCDNTSFNCDTYHLTVTLPTGYVAAHPNAVIKVTMGWTDTGTGQSDYDLYIYKLPRTDCASTTGTASPDCTYTDGNESADYQSATSNNPEVATITPADGTTNYTVHIVPYTPTGETVNVTAQLFPGAAASGGGGNNGNFGGPDATAANVPRYMNFYAPDGTSAQSASGEFNIGYNPATHRVMMMNLGPIWRLTLPEYLAQAKPECCEAFWEDVDNATTNTGLDPILWTDQNSGRTFSSNSTAGANVVYGYSDNDGTSWTPVGAALPNGGADHETIGTGPYPSGLTSFGNTVNKGHAVYYCSQDIVGPAACYRSDTLGASYGASTFAYTGHGAQGCGGLHGHIHIAPDGTVWLPVNQCNGHQGGVFSTDAGTTWTEFIVPNNLASDGTPTGISQSNGADPSIGNDANSRIYYGYVNNQANGNEGHARVATGTLTGCTTNTVTLIRSGCSISWGSDIDLGTTHGIVNAAEIEATQGGDAGRAAVAFLGTNHNGDYQSGAFPGDWYAFIATTYDNGNTWTTVNATPNDPVQHAIGIWQQGGSGQNGDRNLLDFTEITIGDKGQVLYGYSDGCVSSGCVNKTAPNDGVAYMRVARQTGGKTMYAAYDVSEPIAPKAPCLSGTRDASGSYLEWKVPDNGGSDITAYQIYRSTTSGTETLIATYSVNNNSKAEYVDTTADPNVPVYYYKITAVNGPKGAGTLSNEIALNVVIPPTPQSPCILPGVTVLTDPTGDSTNPLAGTDLISASVAQPYSTDGSQNMVFTIVTAPDPNGTASKVPGSAWYLAMKLVNGSTTTYTGVRMEGGATPAFYYYTPSGNTSGTVDGRFVASKTATTGSYNPTTGIITINATASQLGLATGTVIQGFVAGSTQTTDVAGTGAGATEVWDSMPDSLAFTNTYTVVANNTCAPLQSVVSRRNHAGHIYDITLPGVEPRNGTQQVVFNFLQTVTVPGTVTVSPAGSGTTAIGSDGKSVVVTLSGIPNASRNTITLNGVTTGGAALTGLTGQLNVLLGDTTGDGVVNSADVSQTKARSGQVLSATNFRSDVTVDGNINSADVSLVKAKSGTALP
ncbi:MAG: hypothetical protein JO354_12250 [Verrucomicrobia bacterium]|nr:hypothetical protein [Verrucomicrobiota bacterium]